MAGRGPPTEEGTETERQVSAPSICSLPGVGAWLLGTGWCECVSWSSLVLPRSQWWWPPFCEWQQHGPNIPSGLC